MPVTVSVRFVFVFAVGAVRLFASLVIAGLPSSAAAVPGSTKTWSIDAMEPPETVTSHAPTTRWWTTVVLCVALRVQASNVQSPAGITVGAVEPPGSTTNPPVAAAVGGVSCAEVR